MPETLEVKQGLLQLQLLMQTTGLKLHTLLRLLGMLLAGITRMYRDIHRVHLPNTNWLSGDNIYPWTCWCGT